MNHWEEDDTFLGRWLNNELSPEEKATFEGSEEGKEYIAMIQAAELLKAPEYDTSGELSKFKNRIAKTPKPEAKVIWMRPAFKYAVAASLLLITVITYLLQPKLTTITTGFGEQEIAHLPDGSEVRLNANSSIAYDPDIWNKKRQVELVGEAFFQVKKGSDFVVETKGGAVKVLGTSFNVRSRDAVLDVVCFTGKVKVNSMDVDKELTPGMSVRVENGMLVRSGQKKLNKNPSWLDGITTLENVPLTEALAEMEHIFGIRVEYQNLSDSIMYNGSFPNKKVESAFQLVLEPLHIRYTYDAASKRLIIHGIE